MSEELYNMDLHSEIQIKGLYILRVPGGWWYFKGENHIFIKFDPEFKYPSTIFFVNDIQIIDMVSNYYYHYFGLRKDFHLIKTKKPEEVEGKHMIVKLLKDILQLKQEDIRKILRYKERSSISFAYKTISKDIDSDEDIRKRYWVILRKLNLLGKR